MKLTDYQDTICGLLEARLVSPTDCEWRTQINIGIYSPKLDIAVGPFAIENFAQFIVEYDVLIRNNIGFIINLVKCHLTNLSKIKTHQITRSNP